QRTIEEDEHIGGAIRDLKSALRGEEEPYRAPKPRKQIEATPSPDSADSPSSPDSPSSIDAAGDPASASSEASATANGEAARSDAASNGSLALAEPAPKLTLPPTAGESDAPAGSRDDAELAALVKPAPNTIARGTSASPDPHEPGHG